VSVYFGMIRKMVLTYRSIFLFFGVMFLFLAAFICTHTTPWRPAWFPTHGWMLQPIVAGIAAGLGLYALVISCALRFEREAVRFFAGKARRAVRIHYFTSLSTQSPIMLDFYDHLIEEIAIEREKALHLIDRINHADEVQTHERPGLHRQVIEDFRLKLEKIASNI